VKYFPRQQALSLVGMFLLSSMVVCVMVGPFFYRTSPFHIDFRLSLLPPSFDHPFGTNDLGQDVLARVLIGGRVSLAVGLCSMTVACVVGTSIGTLSGFVGGVLDMLLMGLTDLFLSLPMLPLLLLIMYLFRETLAGFLGPEYGVFLLIVVVIGGLTWMPVARLVRASVLSVRTMDFVIAARVSGASSLHLVWHHILPNVVSPVIVAAALSVSWAIITESTLSFLGLGFPPDTPSWGRMLFEAKEYLDIAPHMAIFPGIVVFLTVLSTHFIADGIQGALNPRLRSF
jgi:peptide/nickel transport system permease protein